MWIENWNYIEQDGINELNNSLSDINTGTTRWLGQVNQEINNSKYNLDRDINPELDDFLSDWKLDKGEIKALTEIFEYNKTWIINISKKNLEWLRKNINSTKKQNYVWDSEKNIISDKDTENKVFEVIEWFNFSNLKESFIKLKELDNSLENVKDISKKLKDIIISSLEEKKHSLNNYRALVIPEEKNKENPLISWINDLLSDLLKDEWLFNIENKDFQEALSKLVIERERITWEEVFWNIWSDFLLTIEKLDKSINSNSKVVLIWINNYDKIQDLSWAINDITKMKEYVMKIYWIPEENIIMIKDKEATKENILKKISLSSKDSKWGTMVYYSGHWIKLNTNNILETKQKNSRWLGRVENNNTESYIAAVWISSTESNNLHINNYISSKELSEALNWKWLIITDMCYSWDFIISCEKMAIWLLARMKPFQVRQRHFWMM